MRWLLLAAVVVLAAAAAWWAWPRELTPTPLAQAGPDDAVDAGLSASLDAALPIADPSDAAIALDVDAGAPVIDVLVEVLDGDGHVAGANVGFGVPKHPGYHLCDLRTVTDVMGFAHIALKPGTYDVCGGFDEHYAPDPVTVDADHATLTLRRVPGPPKRLVSGIVLDGSGAPVERADIEVTGLSDRKAWWLAKRTMSDAQGHFQFESSDDAVLIRARLGGRRSATTRVNVPSSTVRLRIFTELGAVRFVFEPSVESAFLQWEAFGELQEVRVIEREPVELPPGRYDIRGRAFDGRLLEGKVNITVTAARGAAFETINLSPRPAVRVNVLDPHQVALPGVSLALVGCAGTTGSTDSDGNAELTPTELCAFDPPYRVEAGGAWRNVERTLAKLEDDPVMLHVRPYDPAVDSTDSGAQVP